jgi:putative transposase
VKKELGSNLEVWERGYTEHRVRDSTDYKQHVVYIRENPVRAALVEPAEAYPYGSAFRSSEIDLTPPWLKPVLERALVSPR